jgi:hypothetical protein
MVDPSNLDANVYQCFGLDFGFACLGVLSTRGSVVVYGSFGIDGGVASFVGHGVDEAGGLD